MKLPTPETNLTGTRGYAPRPRMSDMPLAGKAMMTSGRSYWLGGGVLLLLSLLVFAANTHRGIGIFVDSTRYMGISEKPYDAPFYPWLLMLATAAGASLSGGAKAIGLFFVSANTLLIWHLLVRATGKYGYALAGTALVILSPQFVTLHGSAMSEPPFLFLLLVTVLALLRYLETDSRAWLAASAVALGFATLARFTAPPLGAAIAICLFLNRRLSPQRRFGDAVLFGFVSAAIFLSWVVISQETSGRSIGRDLYFYGNMGVAEWLRSLEALTAWLLPDQIPFALRVIVFALFAATAAWLTFVQSRAAVRRSSEGRIVEAMLPPIFGLFFLFYMGFMVLSTSIEANLALNGRYAFPAYVTTVMMITIVLARMDRPYGHPKLMHHGLIVLAAIVLCGHAARTAVRSHEVRETGYGYASVKWTGSPTIAFLKTLPADAKIYSNGPDAIAYLLERRARFVPKHVELRTGVEDPVRPFEPEMRKLGHALAQDHSYVVIFDNVDWRFYLAREEELRTRFSLKPIFTAPDGRVYVKPKQ